MNVRRQYTFYQGTVTWKDCLIVLSYLFRPWRIKTGPYIKKYTKALEAYLGENTRVFPFASGRMALFAILKALNLPQGSDVLMAAYTCTVVPHAVMYAGLHPVYADIETETFSIDLEDFRKKITPHTKAVILPHNFGIPAKYLSEIMSECRSRNIVLIEDCAISLGAEYQGEKVGTFGAAAICSTDHSKMISTSIGGFAVINDTTLLSAVTELYEKAPHLSTTQCIRVLLQFIYFYIVTALYIYPFNDVLDRILSFFHLDCFFFLPEDKENISLPTKYPYPAKLPDMLARIGLGQLNSIEKNIAHRRHSAAVYLAHFHDQRNNAVQNDTRIKPVYLRYSLTLKTPDHALLDKKLQGYLSTKESWFTSIAQGRYDHFEKIGYRHGSCPHAEDMTRRIVSLPTHLRIDPVRLLKDIDPDGTLPEMFE